ncbi:putative ABC transporter permease [Denitrobacterium detoxificans]|uniref:putative ABC transporter permease n=1 Tax=Denitrobacterium detoxificans TaxID=79604 RepID=UPI0026EA5753|nr:putative ABC transporter permease [Denitrobacterium detoxificans]
MTKKDVFDVARDAVADGFLDEQEVEIILAAARERSEEQPLTTKERAEIMSIVRDSMKGLAFSKLPVPLRVLSILLMVTGALGIFSGVVTLLSLFDSNILVEALEKVTATTAGVVAIAAACSFASTVLSFFVGLRLMRGKRGAASALINVNIALTVVSLVCELMLYGIDLVLLFNFVQLAAQIALSTYLNPSLVNESKLQSGLRELDTEIHAKQGTLGLADPGEGYIRLDFFNLFWTFIVGCVVGLIVEIIFHMVVVEPGVYQDRAGLLWGPFSPIYGVGAVLMTIALNRFKDRNIVFIFVVCTIIGGGFEYFVSWFMEVGFGASAWDYSDQFLGDIFGGRTCLLFASMFGLLGTVWIRLLLPVFLRLFNLIPWKWRYSVTLVCAAFMLVNCVMTLQALDNWGARAAGHVPEAGIEQFYAENFGDEYMANRFQSMTIDPEKSVRS